MNFGNKKLELSKYRDKILFACGLIYFTSVLLWLATQGKLKLPFFSPPPEPPPVQVKQPSAADAEFMAYLRQSLTKIEQKERVNSSQINVKVPSVPNSPATVPQQAPPTVVERIYVPIYPPNQYPAGGGMQPSAAIPSLPSPLPPPKTTYTPTTPSSVPVLTPGAKLLPSPAAIAPTAGYTLVGLLESREQSYVLFNFNGLTKRFTLGEPIGSSGWVLMAVENQRAILHRSGQKRVIEVGQSF